MWKRHVAHMVEKKHVLLSKNFQDSRSNFSHQNFLNAQETFLQSVKRVCGARQPPIQQVPGVERPDTEVNHSPTSIAEMMSRMCGSADCYFHGTRGLLSRVVTSLTRKRPNVAGHKVTSLLCVMVPVSNLIRQTGYTERDLSWFSKALQASTELEHLFMPQPLLPADLK